MGDANDPEVAAISAVVAALDELPDAAAQARVLWYAAERCGLLEQILMRAARH